MSYKRRIQRVWLIYPSKMKAEVDAYKPTRIVQTREAELCKLRVKVGRRTNGHKLSINKVWLKIRRRFLTSEVLKQLSSRSSGGKNTNPF